jgi:hypothetical protein
MSSVLGLTQNDWALFWKQVSTGSKSAAGIGVMLVTLGSALIPYIPSLLAIILIISGVIAICVAGIWAIRNLLIYMRRAMSDMDRFARAMAKVYSEYQSRTGRFDEIDSICERGKREVGPDHVSADALRMRMNANPKVLQIVERVEENGVSLAGYTVLIPLRATATNRILSGEVYRGFQIGAQDISKQFTNASSLYISIIYGRPRGCDRAAMLIDLRERICEVVRSSKNPPILFARPGEVRGRYWMNRVGFTPIDLQRSQIWKLDAAKVVDLFH